MLDKERIYKNFLRLVKAPSISGTADEITGAYTIEEMLLEIPYFQEHRDMVMRVPLKNDPFDRFLIAAFMEADIPTKNTIILTGHYDVVDIEDYGKLKDLAYDPEELTRRIGELPMDEESKKDLASGEWLFGRGTADMKYGHAICLEVMRNYAEEGGLRANLLYVGVCGEETNSEGMLEAVDFFNRFARERDLKYRLLMLTESFMVEGAKEGTKYIQYGVSGKVMPLFFCVGAMTHGEEPFRGLDANLMNSEVYRLMDLNPDFSQTHHGMTAMPPAGLKQQDMKVNYSCSTPLYAFSYYNIATVSLKPEEMMDKLIKVAEDAFDNTVADVEKNVERFTEMAGRPPQSYKITPKVMTYKELYDAVKETYDGDLDAYIKNYIRDQIAQNPELQSACVNTVRELYELYQEKGPVIIVAILPPYYPDVNVDTEDADTCRMLKCNDQIIEYAKEQFGEPMEASEYYGVSDLCYTWLAEGMDFDRMFNNLVGLDAVYQFPAEAIKEFRVPGVVFGSYGKDFHKYTERMHKDYNFRVLPDLFARYIEMFIDDIEKDD